MGLDINAVQFLIAARQAGVEFGEVLTLGRQDLNVYPAKMRKLLAAHGLPAGLFATEATDTKFSEPVFKSLGAKLVSALDASAFEGAAFVHDLNKPIGAELRERFDLVYDGGTLEHVFNFPVALQNCMEMVRGGGRLFLHTVANSYCGHGFYQFSPELFFRAFSPENGYELERIIAHRMGPFGNWYEVSDPERIRSRVELVSFAPIQLLIQARRTRVAPVFAKAPQQSDYTPRWTDRPDAKPPDPVDYSPSRPGLAKSLPGVARVLNVIKIGLGLLRSHSLANRKCFQPVKKP
jgi:SAM-dependent methyltransferase